MIQPFHNRMWRASIATVVVWGVLQIFAAGCYVTRLHYNSDPRVAVFENYHLSFTFDQLDWTAPPETDRGDTAFVLIVQYRCLAAPCKTILEISPPVLFEDSSGSGEQLELIHTYEAGSDSGYTTLEFGTIPRNANRLDTLIIKVPLTTRDSGSGEVRDSSYVRLVGVPEMRRKGVIRQLVEGV